eukprot:CAMPEP_0183441830 /NCGR_PEP_ID=MMETSP0370-20130417/86007_1 /TAXON_ID=268820 /ORGANISM="Peridinium aciculiferum, Strain PAER-2" /LENGTH=43 /DNA_ID= /DNA_START= /DNA_END= /DNA_ORIENTATION=
MTSMQRLARKIWLGEDHAGQARPIQLETIRPAPSVQLTWLLSG